LDRHLSMKMKEIRPLHLDINVGTKEQIRDFASKNKNKFTLRFYDNRPMRRLTSLFTRGT